ncbi:hypothetical protein Bca52824_033305 [Brassica carinata]|uniref:Replication factor A C-terminal domain-containing protein n=1 Tax=Brassica carinata TaxID=52824 RepID=A0A8X7SCL2_BRACI|nr:hypothetical protein Bca52824_033305 [Brassica carinata]
MKLSFIGSVTKEKNEDENCDYEMMWDAEGSMHLDVVGHMKLVNGHTLIERPILDEVEIATTRNILVHVQSYDGPVMKLYLWDQAATEFCKKFKTYENTPSVILVTTVNTKRLGGIANQVSSEVVTKRESLTIADIFAYIKQESPKDAFFECMATIDDVVHGSAWYYIGCSGCHSKVTNGPTSLICANKKCGKVNPAGVAHCFVLLGDAGRQLTGRHASELVSSYFEANENKGADHDVPVPDALLNIIGQKHKFCVKVTGHNFSGNTKAINCHQDPLSLDTAPSTEASVGNNIAATSEETIQTGTSADEGSKRTCESVELEKAKRPRCEN